MRMETFEQTYLESERTVTLKSMKKKPNLLIITTDQHRGDCYGFEGRKVKTPIWTSWQPLGLVLKTA